jgi:hypothetical protein
VIVEPFAPPLASHPNVVMRGNLWFANEQVNAAALLKKREETSFSYELEEIGPSSRYGTQEGARSEDPLFVDPKNGDYSLRSESPAARMGKGGAPIGAPAEVANDAQARRETPPAVEPPPVAVKAAPFVPPPGMAEDDAGDDWVIAQAHAAMERPAKGGLMGRMGASPAQGLASAYRIRAIKRRSRPGQLASAVEDLEHVVKYQNESCAEMRQSGSSAGSAAKIVCGGVADMLEDLAKMKKELAAQEKRP